MAQLQELAPPQGAGDKAQTSLIGSGASPFGGAVPALLVSLAPQPPQPPFGYIRFGSGQNDRFPILPGTDGRGEVTGVQEPNFNLPGNRYPNQRTPTPAEMQHLLTPEQREYLETLPAGEARQAYFGARSGRTPVLVSHVVSSSPGGAVTDACLIRFNQQGQLLCIAYRGRCYTPDEARNLFLQSQNDR